MTYVIECENLKKSFKVNKRPKGFFGHMANLVNPKFAYIDAVSGISFSIKKGEAVGFIGPNGAGKSTTIKMLTGILSPSSGMVTALGLNPQKNRRDYVARIGAVFGQKSQLSWDLPVIDSFHLIKEIYDIPEAEFSETLEHFTDILDMKSFIEQPVRQLSLGQRMRADITASLLHKPEIIFFDEPTIGLDIIAKEKVREFIRYLIKDLNVTVIFTTHDMQDIEEVCERLIIVDKGKKVYDGTVSGVKTQFGQGKKLTVQFEHATEVDELEGVMQLKKPNHVIEFSVNDKNISVNKIMKDLLEKHDVIEFSISEQGIEEIIRDMYESQV